MTAIDAKNKEISIDDANKILDTNSYAMISNCNIIGEGYVSNMASLANIISVNCKDVILVIRDDAQSIVSSSFVKGIRPVSVVCGYAYSHQIKRERSYGC